MQISRFTASKPSKSAIASVEKFTRQLTTLIARYFLKQIAALFLVLAILLPLTGVAEDSVVNPSAANDDIAVAPLDSVEVVPDETEFLLGATPEATAMPEGLVQNPKGVPDDLTLGVKDTFVIDAKKLSKKKKLTFTSEYPKIAAVDKEGKITAKKIGVSTVFCKQGSKTLATIVVTVVPAPKKVKLNLKKLTIGVKESVLLEATLTKDSASTLTWTSDDESVATVTSDGEVKGVKAGKATITVQTHNKKKAKATITVKNKPKKVTLSEKALTLTIGDTHALKATLPKGAASYATTWTSSNTKVATVDEKGVVKAVAPGTAKITVKTFNKKKATCTVTVNASATPAPTDTPTPAPEVTTPAPEVTTPAPEVTTPAPEATTPAPEVTTPAPSESPSASPEATTPAPSESPSASPEATTPTPSDTPTPTPTPIPTPTPSPTPQPSIDPSIEPKLLSPTNLYRGSIYDYDAPFPNYGESDLTLTWTSVMGGTRYDLLIMHYGYSGDGGIRNLAEINQPSTGDDTISLTLKKELLDSYGVQDRIGISLVANDAYGNECIWGVYCFRWIRDFNSLEYDFYYGHDAYYGWPQSNGEVTGIVLTHYYGTDSEVHVPANFGGYPVRSLSHTFFHDTSINKVVIPEGVAEIGLWAFEDCANLEAIIMPNTVTAIGGGAFYGCVALKSITIPDSVTTIALSAFGNCTGLTGIVIPDKVTAIERYVFSGCTNLKNITIPKSVHSIDDTAFEGVTDLTIRGEKGSYAQSWAEEHGYTFVEQDA